MQKLPITILLTICCQLACAMQKEVVISNLLTSSQCPISVEGISLYTSNVALQAALSSGTPAFEIQEPSGNVSTSTLKIESHKWGLAVNLGAKPSMGYGIELAKQGAVINNGVLQIYFSETIPEKTTAQATLMTMPCVIISFDAQKITQIIAISSRRNWAITVKDLTTDGSPH